jgi:hypothetical protein
MRAMLLTTTNKSRSSQSLQAETCALACQHTPDKPWRCIFCCSNQQALQLVHCAKQHKGPTLTRTSLYHSRSCLLPDHSHSKHSVSHTHRLEVPTTHAANSHTCGYLHARYAHSEAAASNTRIGSANRRCQDAAHQAMQSHQNGDLINLGQPKVPDLAAASPVHL